MRAALGALLIFLLTLAIVIASPHFRSFAVPTSMLMSAVCKLLWGLMAVYLVLRYVVKVSPRSAGLSFQRNLPKEFLVGSVIGGAMVVGAFCIAWANGALVVTNGPLSAAPGPKETASLVGAYLFLALFEEVTFRAGMTAALLSRLPVGLAIGIPSSVFGLAHGMNPGATTLGVANTVLAAIFLGFLYLPVRGAERSLGVATGFHFAWNYILGPVLGIPVSGHPPSYRWLLTEANDIRWSGGSYGLEGGFAASIILAVACVLAWWHLTQSMVQSPIEGRTGA